MMMKIFRAVRFLAAGLSVMVVCSCSAPQSAHTGAFVDVGKSRASGDFQRLQGSWKVTSCEVNGVVMPERNGTIFHFKGDQHWISGDKGKEQFAVDGTVSPKQIDFYDGKSATIRGIYQIEGDELTECTADPGYPRPERMASTFMSHTIVTRLRKL